MPNQDGSSQSPQRTALENFSSQWFLIPQGTGITAVILHQLNYQFDGLHIISYIFWILTIIFLVVLLLIYITHCIFFPKTFKARVTHDVGEIACLSSIVISYTSIIQMTSLVLVHSWGQGWGTAVCAMWWTNAVLAVIAAIGIPFVYIRVYPVDIHRLVPSSQLPLIATLTAAAGGGTICQSAQISAGLQVPVIIVSYLLLAMGLAVAFALDVLYWAKLLSGSLPQPSSVFQDMILCGPWGQASFALQELGGVVLGGSFAAYDSGKFLTAQAAPVVGYASIFAGLLSWGVGTFWWIFGILSIMHAGTDHWRPHKIPYSLAVWSVVFPWVSSDGANLSLFADFGRACIPMRRCSLGRCLILRRSRSGLRRSRFY